MEETVLELNESEKAILCALVTKDQSDEEVDYSLDELERLLITAGGECFGRLIQSKSTPDTATYFGKGKIQELSDICSNNEISLVVFDDELSPSQIKNIEDGLEDVKVIDRTMLILDIFAKHAVTGEGKIQVELAQLKYSIPRLFGKGNELSRLGGGIGTRGPGETKLETDRRHLNRRISSLRKSLEEIKKNRDTQHIQRKQSGLKNVAIVGYTNAGKSTLLNYLTDAGILAEDKLFATLDPTTRKYQLPCGIDILLTDTVGFINKLPHHLVEAFKSTLDEVKYADVILILIDKSDPQCDSQLEVTHRTLWDLGVHSKPTIYVYNKVDCDGETQEYPSKPDGPVYISAKTGYGIDRLICKIEDIITNESTIEYFDFPMENVGLVNQLYKTSIVSDVKYTENGCRVKAIVDKKTKGLLKDYLVGDKNV